MYLRQDPCILDVYSGNTFICLLPFIHHAVFDLSACARHSESIATFTWTFAVPLRSFGDPIYFKMEAGLPASFSARTGIHGYIFRFFCFIGEW